MIFFAPIVISALETLTVSAIRAIVMRIAKRKIADRLDILLELLSSDLVYDLLEYIYLEFKDDESEYSKSDFIDRVSDIADGVIERFNSTTYEIPASLDLLLDLELFYDEYRTTSIPFIEFNGSVYSLVGEFIMRKADMLKLQKRLKNFANLKREKHELEIEVKSLKSNKKSLESKLDRERSRSKELDRDLKTLRKKCRDKKRIDIDIEEEECECSECIERFDLGILYLPDNIRYYEIYFDRDRNILYKNRRYYRSRLDIDDECECDESDKSCDDCVEFDREGNLIFKGEKYYKYRVGYSRKNPFKGNKSMARKRNLIDAILSRNDSDREVVEALDRIANKIESNQFIGKKGNISAITSISTKRKKVNIDIPKIDIDEQRVEIPKIVVESEEVSIPTFKKIDLSDRVSAMVEHLESIANGLDLNDSEHEIVKAIKNILLDEESNSKEFRESFREFFQFLTKSPTSDIKNIVKSDGYIDISNLSPIEVKFYESLESLQHLVDENSLELEDNSSIFEILITLLIDLISNEDELVDSGFMDIVESLSKSIK